MKGEVVELTSQILWSVGEVTPAHSMQTWGARAIWLCLTEVR